VEKKQYTGSDCEVSVVYEWVGGAGCILQFQRWCGEC
jgi:hypothetical protein